MSWLIFKDSVTFTNEDWIRFGFILILILVGLLVFRVVLWIQEKSNPTPRPKVTVVSTHKPTYQEQLDTLLHGPRPIKWKPVPKTAGPRKRHNQGQCKKSFRP